MRYTDFINFDYKPSKEDLIALYRVEPAKGYSVLDAASRVAAESSVGTWSDIRVSKFVEKIAAKVYRVSGKWVEIAYPIELFEEGNMPQILSSIAGNIFGMKALKKLRLEDVSWPDTIKRWFRGPKYGIEGVRNILDIHDRPLLASVPKPKVGLTIDEYLDTASKLWSGGIDLVKDDENLTSQSFIRFKDRVGRMFRLRDKVEKETGERKGYLINVSAPYHEMIKRARLVADHGGEFIMIDVLTTGFSSVQGIIEEFTHDLGLAIHAHRAFHAAFTRDPRHGMSMKVIVEIFRMLGVDHIHVGTVVGKLYSPAIEVSALTEICRGNIIKGDIRKRLLYNDWRLFRPIFPVSSGGLHPGLLPNIIKFFGKDVIIQVGGGVAGHPRGFYAGAKAVRETIEGILDGLSLDEIRRRSVYVDDALKKWRYERPT